jgi:hypothetical protein
MVMIFLAIAFVVAGWLLSSAICEIADEVRDFNDTVERIELLLQDEDDWS